MAAVSSFSALHFAKNAQLCACRKSSSEVDDTNRVECVTKIASAAWQLGICEVFASADARQAVGCERNVATIHVEERKRVYKTQAAMSSARRRPLLPVKNAFAIAPHGATFFWQLLSRHRHTRHV